MGGNHIPIENLHFLRIARYLEEHDEEQISINDLINKINDYLDGTDFESYRFQYMKNASN